MMIKEAMEAVKSDKSVLLRALSMLDTVQALYAVGEGERAIDLYGVVNTQLRLALRHFPILEQRTASHD